MRRGINYPSEEQGYLPNAVTKSDAGEGIDLRLPTAATVPSQTIPALIVGTR